jgi:hypothetical protein
MSKKVYGNVWVKVPVEVVIEGCKILRSYMGLSIMLENPWTDSNKLHVRDDNTGEIKIFEGSEYIKRLDCATSSMSGSEVEYLHYGKHYSP